MTLRTGHEKPVYVRLRESERAVFVREEWPAIRERMKRLGLDADELLKAERA